MRRSASTWSAARMPADGSAPIADLNITPLIDVMLVLLVMMILLLPVATHQVPIDLPQPRLDRALPQTTHRLELSRTGAVTLDGVATDDAGLARALPALTRDPQAVLTLRTDPEARYERFDQLLAVVKRAGVTRLGFVGNEAMVE